jgi:hypothetical protein
MIAFSGVRNSWLVRARKSLFASDAACAFDRVSRSWLLRVSSASSEALTGVDRLALGLERPGDVGSGAAISEEIAALLVEERRPAEMDPALLAGLVEHQEQPIAESPPRAHQFVDRRHALRRFGQTPERQQRLANENFRGRAGDRGDPRRNLGQAQPRIGLPHPVRRRPDDVA